MPQVLLYRFEVIPGLNRHNCAGMPKLVEAENEGILVEVENGTWYNPLKGYGLRHSPFLLRRNNHGTKEQKIP